MKDLAEELYIMNVMRKVETQEHIARFTFSRYGKAYTVTIEFKDGKQEPFRDTSFYNCFKKIELAYT